MDSGVQWAYDFQGISNICALCGLSRALEIISASWDYTLCLDQYVEWFPVSSINSLYQVEKLWKEIQMCRWECMGRKALPTLESIDSLYRCTLNVDNSFHVSAQAAATNRSIGCAILGSYHNLVAALAHFTSWYILSSKFVLCSSKFMSSQSYHGLKLGSLLYPYWRCVLE